MDREGKEDKGDMVDIVESSMDPLVNGVRSVVAVWLSVAPSDVVEPVRSSETLSEIIGQYLDKLFYLSILFFHFILSLFLKYWIAR